jgi:streptogramin lyase
MPAHLSKRLLLCFALYLGTSCVDAQYRIDQWTADSGLPQNSVYGIVQTADGYLWIATVDGLARFDGVQFSVFNKGNSSGIINNRFISLFEDAGRNLWAGTEESGVVRFRGGAFESFGTEAGVPRSVKWIEADAEGVGTIFQGPDAAVRLREGKFSPVNEQPNLPKAADASSNIKILCRPGQERKFSECFVRGRWISFSVDDGSASGKLSVTQDANADGSIPIRFVSAAQGADGIVWLITADGRLARADNGRVTHIYDERDGLPKYPMYLIVGAKLGLVSKDSDEALWLVDLPSLQKDLLLKGTGGTFPRDKLEFLSTYADEEGNLWFGTKRDGLFRARKQVITAYSEADGIKDKTVYPIYQDHAGKIWLGGGSGLFKRENGTFVPVESTGDFLVSAISEDSAGRVLISNFGALFVLENNKFVPFEPAKIPPLGFIYAVHADGEKALWIGSAGGLRRFKDGVLTSITTADGLAGDDVKVIIEARSGGLWIGTYEGLTRFKDGRLTTWREADGLPSRTVRALYEEADGTLWIGSYDGGLARFKDGKFTRYDMKVGLPNDGAFQILADDDRHFWISSNRGIYSVSRDELNDFADGKIARISSTVYGKSDGMLSIECNGGRWPAVVRADDGRLWFPTQDGVAIIDPKNIKINSQPPPVVIEAVTVDNELTQPPSTANASSAAKYGAPHSSPPLLEPAKAGPTRGPA